jgi:DNA repair and recombination protein RAD52
MDVSDLVVTDACVVAVSEAIEQREGRTATIGRQLERFLGPEYVSYRKGEGNKQLAYLEGHEVIGIANTIFGWDKWSSKPVSFTTDYAETTNGGKWQIGVACTVRVTVLVFEGATPREVCHEDVGYGTIDNAPGRGKGMEKCRKEAVTDGLKRALRNFGSATGGCMYNKRYLELVGKVKGPAERIEFVDEDLFRKPINKRKRLMMAQEKAQVIRLKPGDDVKEEYELENDDDWMQEVVALEDGG